MLYMNTDEVAKKIKKLRNKRGVTARRMSLELGQSPAYINRIETGKMAPSLKSFLEICDFLNITPQDFFAPDMEDITDSKNIEPVKHLIYNLSPEQLAHVAYIIKQMTR